MNYNVRVGVEELDSYAAATHRNHREPVEWRGREKTDHLWILLVKKSHNVLHFA